MRKTKQKMFTVYLMGQTQTQPDAVYKNVLDVDLTQGIRMKLLNCDGEERWYHFNPECYRILWTSTGPENIPEYLYRSLKGR